ncbi:DNA/RNA non-specific endonuclease [uncultured Tenacibaculum sp.]|uniref:DNA/RNA non-specific endonuclease n=1 Tax=uncultured Tenacibaculum sp. TaxID=174713 RepID=UPI002609A80B|nr:DNA/RNA non-specific endonuclease [uncultured Tenacibaculum sp.]
MRKKNVISVLLVLGVMTAYYYTEKKEQVISKDVNTTENKTPNDSSKFNYLPSSTTGQIIHHNGYSLSYDEKHEQAEWVAYRLHSNDIAYSKFKRPYFIQDPKVKTQSSDWRNYKKSGYDKGHLCPAGDRKATLKAFNETFYTSNITPQKHDFNAGIWNRLEQKVRYWAKRNKQVYVVTGGILNSGNKTIGKEKVTVPNTFYKIVLDYTKPEIKAIAFLIPHKESKKPLYDFVTSIDIIEKKTGIDFFGHLPDNIENKLETSKDYKKWSFK